MKRFVFVVVLCVLLVGCFVDAGPMAPEDCVVVDTLQNTAAIVVLLETTDARCVYPAIRTEVQR